MDAKIISNKENGIIGRKEIHMEVSFEKNTPNRKELKQFLCSKVGANPDTAVLRSVETNFGIRALKALLHVYQSKEAALATEPRHILARDGMAEKKKKKEKKKAAPPAKK
ncbi:MAG: 30S ribosomal protein S24e [Candidatus ainarchaeum sp.]|nr:30S ribosomal protein S24e [Candidatus ainarchaeum sp.]